jgi:hypothetical protein
VLGCEPATRSISSQLSDTSGARDGEIDNPDTVIRVGIDAPKPGAADISEPGTKLKPQQPEQPNTISSPAVSDINCTSRRLVWCSTTFR